MKRNYDYSKLKGRVIEKLGSLKKYAEMLSLSDTALSNKLKNKTAFSQDEILKSMDKDVLDIPETDVSLYFFTQKVGENQTNEIEED
ncbi:MAG: DUF739 family protein [Bacilli bacterium]|nr:DUF739 family protein [Bacilli bacterium]